MIRPVAMSFSDPSDDQLDFMLVFWRSPQELGTIADSGIFADSMREEKESSRWLNDTRNR